MVHMIRLKVLEIVAWCLLPPASPPHAHTQGKLTDWFPLIINQMYQINDGYMVYPKDKILAKKLIDDLFQLIVFNLRYFINLWFLRF